MKFSLEMQTADPVHVQIERFLQRQLQNGELTIGQRLPSNAKLARSWGVSCTDVQRAMSRLTAAGLIERARRRGTFVKAASGNALIAILTKQSLADETAHLARALVAALQVQLGERDWNGRVYDGLKSDRAPGQPALSLPFRHLEHDLLNYPFKGLVELNSDLTYPRNLKPRLDLPRVRFGILSRAPDVCMDTYRFTSETVTFLSSHQHRNICYLRTSEDLPANTEDLDGLYDAIRTCGLPSPQIERVETGRGGYFLECAAYQKTRQLVRRWKSRRNRPAWPDAFLVADDIAARGATLALVQEGVDVPGRMVVATHANEGINLHYGIPVIRYEFSPLEIAKELLAILWERMLAKKVSSRPVLVPGRLRVDEGLPFVTAISEAAISGHGGTTGTSK